MRSTPRLVSSLVNGEKLKIKPLPDFMVQLLNEGGLVPYLKTHMKEW